MTYLACLPCRAQRSTAEHSTAVLLVVHRFSCSQPASQPASQGRFNSNNYLLSKQKFWREHNFSSTRRLAHEVSVATVQPFLCALDLLGKSRSTCKFWQPFLEAWHLQKCAKFLLNNVPWKVFSEIYASERSNMIGEKERCRNKNARKWPKLSRTFCTKL